MTALTDDVGEVTYNYEYDPYGVEISEPGASESMNPYRYCGEYFDAETGFTYLRARYYDAKIGRFISEDPALDGLNWYAYCGNDPVNKIDPSGEFAVAIKVGVDVAIIVVDLLSKAATAAASVYLVDVVYNKVTGKKEYYYSSSKEVAKPQPGPKPSMKPRIKPKSKAKRKVKIDNNRSRHIFRDAKGHLKKDTPKNRKKLENVANNNKNHLGKDKYGNDWYAKENANGSQTWTQVRDGKIINGGVNDSPKSFNPKTGLSAPAKLSKSSKK